MKITLLDKDKYNEIKNGDGYCPCSIVKNEDTKCMCKDFREQVEAGECFCGIFRKEDE